MTLITRRYDNDNDNNESHSTRRTQRYDFEDDNIDTHRDVTISSDRSYTSLNTQDKRTRYELC
jgi:hypothetical protein